MSLNIFENTNLDFDVSIIKTARVTEDSVVKDVIQSITPLEPAAVLDLEIRESTLNMGFVGSITINNKFKILDKLNITTNSPHDVYIAIKITDVELKQTSLSDTDTCVTLVGDINSTGSAAKDEIDGIVVFSFEEAFVAAMRQTQSIIFTGKTLADGEKYINQDETDYNVVTLVNAFNERIFKLRNSPTIVTKDSRTPNVLFDVQLAITEKNQSISSVYDTVKAMLDGSCIGNQSNSSRLTAQPSYLRMVNTLPTDTSNGNVVRQMKFDTFFTSRHREFVDAVANNKASNSNFSDVYLEKFTLGALADTQPTDPNITLYNRIEVYDTTRANIQELKQSIWGDYRFDKKYTGKDLSKFSAITIDFFTILQDFVYANFSNLKINFNLPILDPKNLNEFHIPFNSYASDKEVQRSLVQQSNKIINKVHKSFFTIIETISFTVKGSVIRQPNKFIWLEDGSQDKDYKKLWYVNSVQHKFSNGKYTNNIIATKVFGDTTLDTLLSKEIENTIQTNNTTSNS